MKRMTYQNMYENLLAQADKLRKHNRQGSRKTKDRYFAAYKRFLKFLAEEFQLQKIANIKPKHMYDYVDYIEAKNKISTIKTDLSAIRFWQDKIPGAEKLPTNKELNLKNRIYGGIDRTWTQDEFEYVINQAKEDNLDNFVGVLYIARYMGFRIHEAFRIDTAIAREALKKGFVTIKGKGGKMRKVPNHPTIELLFREFLKKTPAGEKLFVPSHQETHKAIEKLQQFVIKTRKDIPDYDPDTVQLTVHGLRHTWARETHNTLLEQGLSDKESRKQVSQWLGHEREEVTNIYLPPQRKKGGDAVEK